MEEKGIARPSTYASIVDKIISRGYVKISNVEGRQIICNNYVLIGNKLEMKSEVCTFGNEKNKLIFKN